MRRRLHLETPLTFERKRIDVTHGANSACARQEVVTASRIQDRSSNLGV